MVKTKNIDVKYEGENIRVGIHKKTGKTYFQIVDSEPSSFWYRFEPEYYLDYEEYIKEYVKYIRSQTSYPDLSYSKVLTGDVLDHYIHMYNPVEVTVNNECIYSQDNDLEYCVTSYKEDMKLMSSINFLPYIKNISIQVVDNHHFKIDFKISIEHSVGDNLS